MKKSNRTQYRGESWKNIENIIALGYSRSNVFSDWIDLMLLAHLSLSDNFKRGNSDFSKFDGEYEKRYLEIMGNYKSDGIKGKRPADYFMVAYQELLKEIEGEKTNTSAWNNGHDPLGDIYMMEITYGEHGQFFTPFHIGDAMAKIIGDIKDGERVLDPCCGSGTLLLAAAQYNPKAVFTAIDLDGRCAKMCALNMLFRGLTARVLWGNSLSGDMQTEWKISNGLIIENPKPENWEFPKKEMAKEGQLALI